MQKLNKFWAIDGAVTFGLKKENINRSEGIYDSNGEFVPFSIPDFEVNQPSFRPAISLRRGGSKTSLNLSLAGYSVELEKRLDDTIDKTKNFYLLPSMNYRNHQRTGSAMLGRLRCGSSLPIGFPPARTNSARYDNGCLLPP